ncbi:YciO family [Salmonella enterica subsp. enterica]|uniref:YciO family n=1 Tax=Salmonella enterica I TaxID=59201 RepID=A0A379WU69_SALET|nr:YciO family [Salmonella enterica subsp. enterica]
MCVKAVLLFIQPIPAMPLVVKLKTKAQWERICRIRHLPDGHNFTLMCRDLSELSTYSYVDNVAFRLMKNNYAG